MRELKFLVAAGLCLTASAASAIVVAPSCTAPDGTYFHTSEPLADGLVVGRGDLDGVEVVVLASCASSTQVRVTSSLSDYIGGAVYEEFVRAVASAQTFTFEDLAAKYNNGSYGSAITSISADLCSCLSEGM